VKRDRVVAFGAYLASSRSVLRSRRGSAAVNFVLATVLLVTGLSLTNTKFGREIRAVVQGGASELRAKAVRLFPDFP